MEEEAAAWAGHMEPEGLEEEEEGVARLVLPHLQRQQGVAAIRPSRVLPLAIAWVVEVPVGP